MYVYCWSTVREVLSYFWFNCCVCCLGDGILESSLSLSLWYPLLEVDEHAELSLLVLELTAVLGLVVARDLKMFICRKRTLASAVCGRVLWYSFGSIAPCLTSTDSADSLEGLTSLFIKSGCDWTDLYKVILALHRSFGFSMSNNNNTE